MPEPDEKTIIEQAQQDPRAFAALYERYIDRIYGFIYRRIRDVATTPRYHLSHLRAGPA